MNRVDDALGGHVNVQNSEVFLQMVADEGPAIVDHVADLEVCSFEGDEMVL